MRTPYAAVLDALVTIASGCVTSREPIGDATPALDSAAWNGVWVGTCVGTCTEEDVPTLVAIEVTDVRQARVVFTWPTMGEGGLVFRRAGATLRALRGDLFANLESGDDPEALDCYIPLRIRQKDDRIVAWELDADVVRGLVAGGVIPGTGTELHRLSARDRAALHERLSSAVDWGGPLLFRRVAGSGDMASRRA